MVWHDCSSVASLLWVDLNVRLIIFIKSKLDCGPAQDSNEDQEHDMHVLGAKQQVLAALKHLASGNHVIPSLTRLPGQACSDGMNSDLYHCVTLHCIQTCVSRAAILALMPWVARHGRPDNCKPDRASPHIIIDIKAWPTCRACVAGFLESSRRLESDHILAWYDFRVKALWVRDGSCQICHESWQCSDMTFKGWMKLL